MLILGSGTAKRRPIIIMTIAADRNPSDQPDLIVIEATKRANPARQHNKTISFFIILIFDLNH